MQAAMLLRDILGRTMNLTLTIKWSAAIQLTLWTNKQHSWPIGEGFGTLLMWTSMHCFTVHGDLKAKSRAS